MHRRCGRGGRLAALGGWRPWTWVDSSGRRWCTRGKQKTKPYCSTAIDMVAPSSQQPQQSVANLSELKYPTATVRPKEPRKQNLRRTPLNSGKGRAGKGSRKEHKRGKQRTFTRFGGDSPRTVVSPVTALNTLTGTDKSRQNKFKSTRKLDQARGRVAVG